MDGNVKSIWWSAFSSVNRSSDQNNNCVIECKSKYFRPAEVDSLKGDYSKAKKILNWRPKHNIHSLIDDMIKYEIKNLNNDR